MIGLIKDELRETTMTAFTGLTPKTYSYFIDDDREDQKAKGTEKKFIKTNT